MSDKGMFAADMVKVDKGGVYRDKDTGHAISLREGAMMPADTMDRYKLDSGASEARTKRNAGRATPRLGGIIDAPPPIEERRMPTPEANKAEKPVENKSDKDLAPRN